MAMTDSPSEYEAYVRGLDAGRIEQRLQGHDDHLRQINGSLDAMTQALQDLTDELRENVAEFSAGVTSDRRDAGERERIAATVAAALVEKATRVEAARTTRWTAWQRGFAVLGAIILIGNFVVALYLTRGR